MFLGRGSPLDGSGLVLPPQVTPGLVGGATVEGRGRLAEAGIVEVDLFSGGARRRRRRVLGVAGFFSGASSGGGGGGGGCDLQKHYIYSRRGGENISGKTLHITGGIVEQGGNYYTGNTLT